MARILNVSRKYVNNMITGGGGVLKLIQNKNNKITINTTWKYSFVTILLCRFFVF